MKSFKLAGICVLVSTLALSGCVARTYNLTRDRVDQDLSSTSGNRGYLMGSAPQTKERETTRTVRVFEIELGKNKNSNLNCPATTPLASNSESPMITQHEETTFIETTTFDFQKYKVGKNDTLQKISKKFYGTTKRWPKIYDANKDVLSGPNKLYPGQTLKIPSTGITKTVNEETAENLK